MPERLAEIRAVVDELDAALSAQPRRMIEAFEVKQRLDPWDAVVDLLEEVDRLRAALQAIYDHRGHWVGGEQGYSTTEKDMRGIAMVALR